VGRWEVHGEVIEGCINVLGVVPTPSSAELEEPLNADEGVGITDSLSLRNFPKR